MLLFVVVSVCVCHTDRQQNTKQHTHDSNTSFLCRFFPDFFFTFLSLLLLFDFWFDFNRWAVWTLCCFFIFEIFRLKWISKIAKLMLLLLLSYFFLFFFCVFLVALLNSGLWFCVSGMLFNFILFFRSVNQCVLQVTPSIARVHPQNAKVTLRKSNREKNNQRIYFLHTELLLVV